MRKTAQLWLVLVLCTLAVPAFAGTVYVPYSGGVAFEDATYITRIWATNTGTETRRLEYYMIELNEDGTVRNSEPTVVFVEAGATRVIHISQGRGLVEILGAPQIVVSARLVRTDGVAAGVAGTQLPIVSLEDVGEAGETLHLQGWERRAAGANAQTNFGVVNLSADPAACQVDVRRADGSFVVQDVGLPLAPLSHLRFDQVLGVLGEDQVTDVRVETSCDQRFYAYAAVYYPATGSLVLIEPAGATSDDVATPAAPDFVYLSDLQWTGQSRIQNGPHVDRTGFDPHHPAGPIGGYKQIEINGVTYEKGISWFPQWSSFVSSMTWTLGGQYQRLEMKVRCDDEVFGEYEWGIVNRATGDFIRLERPPDGFRGRERFNQFRIGGSASLRILGDGNVLYQSPEFHGYGPAVDVSVDIRGVDQLRIELLSSGHEEANAPYRNGLPNPPALVKGNVWHDLVVLADPKLFPN